MRLNWNSSNPDNDEDADDIPDVFDIIFVDRFDPDIGPKGQWVSLVTLPGTVAFPA